MTAVRSTLDYFLDDLAALSSLLLTEDLQASLQRVAELGVEYVGGCDQIGVSLVREDRVETGVYLGGAVCEIDGAECLRGDRALSGATGRGGGIMGGRAGRGGP